MGSMNYAKYSTRRKDFVFKAVFANPFDEIIELLEAMNELGHQARARVLRRRPRRLAGAADRHGRARRRRCTSTSSWASSAACRRPRATSPRWPTTCPTGRHHWGVIGISPRAVDAGRRGAHARRLVRVGLEDNFYLPDGAMARSNGDLIAKARQMTEDVGRRPATVDEARALLGAAARGAAAA